MTKKTLEEYQIQEIARSVFKESSGDFVHRGEYDLHVAEKSAMMTSLTRDIGTLQKAEEERLKDKKTMKFQLTGVAIGFVFQFIIWAIVASNGFKIGGN
jgi:hypothetical protein